MSLRLPAKLEPGAGLRAVLLSLARQARRDVERVSDNPEERIHSLRTCMKKYRALLRLAGGEVTRRMWEVLIERVRILKDGMAGSRDDVVIFKTVQAVLGRSAVRRLNLKMPHGERSVVPPEPLLRAAVELVVLTEALDLKGLGAGDLKRHWKRSVRRSRKAMERAANSPEAHDFHVWRKRVKNVWYKSAALGAMGKKIATIRRPAAKLGELLGSEHDMTIVLETVKGLTAGDRSVLVEERKRLRSLALDLGTKNGISAGRARRAG